MNLFFVPFIFWATLNPSHDRLIVQITDDGYFKQRPNWSSDGKRLLFARHQGDKILLWVRDIESGTETRLTTRTAPEYDGVFSPDDETIAFALAKTSPGQGDLDVYRITIKDKSLAPVVKTEGTLSHEESPSWSPDGKRIAYSSTKPGNQELFTIGVDGSSPTRLTNDPAIDTHPDWSPDGKTIVFATNRWGDMELALVDATGSNLRRLTTSAGLDDYPSWSPDGQHLAFSSIRTGNMEVFVMTADGRHVINVTNHPRIDNFSTWIDSDHLGFVSNRGDGFDIYSLDVKDIVTVEN